MTLAHLSNAGLAENDPAERLRRLVAGWLPCYPRPRTRVLGVCAVRVDGRELLASASHDHTVRIWDPGTGRLVHVIPVHYAALGLASFNHSSIAVGHSAGLLALTVG